jgi:hypothetical protein
VTAILVRCSGCGSEVGSTECDRELRCLRCAALALIGADLATYQRLWAKRARYARCNAAVAGPETQLRRLAARMARKLHERITDQTLATEMLNTALEGARQRADSADGRILVPRQGQEILGGGARA